LISLDTETTGLWWQHDTETFAIGIDRDGVYESHTVPIEPLTRKPACDFDTSLFFEVANLIYDSGPLVFQNANFDLKALCKAKLLHWRQPGEPDFWDNIIELGHISHLYNSTDAGGKSSLKSLAPRYLDCNYDSQKELDRIVNRCRIFIRNRRRQWKIASKKTIPQGVGNFVKCDMWLPKAIYTTWEDRDELGLAMERGGDLPSDYHLLDHVTDDYLKDDCRYTRELAEGFLTSLMDTYQVEELDRLSAMNRDLLPVIWKMETLGINVHKEELNDAIDICNQWIYRCHQKCCEAAEMDVPKFTPALMREVLFNQFELRPPTYTEKTGMPQVNKAAIQTLLDEEPHAKATEFLVWLTAGSKYQTKERYLSSYKKVIQRALYVPYNINATYSNSWFLFPSLKSTGTATTRFSSGSPNSQNIEKGGSAFKEHPKVAEALSEAPQLRKIFGPEQGRWWFAIDYSQLQLRIFAAATQDPALIQSFDDGRDFHDFMAHIIFNLSEGDTPTLSQRRIAKNVNFGFIFGASSDKIDLTAHREGLYTYLMDCFPGAKQFLDDTKKKIRSTGQIHTLGGYPLQIPVTPNPWNGEYTYAAHMGVNYIVQGTEGEIVKRAMVQTDRYLTSTYPEARLVMQIHDEIIFDTPANPPPHHIHNLCRIMERAGSFYGVTTPVEPEVCYNNLAEKEKYHE